MQNNETARHQRKSTQEEEHGNHFAEPGRRSHGGRSRGYPSPSGGIALQRLRKLLWLQACYFWVTFCFYEVFLPFGSPKLTKFGAILVRSGSAAAALLFDDSNA